MPSTNWKEVVTPGEAERHELYGERLRTIQRACNKRGNGRALHRKSLLSCEARLEVMDSLPEYARVGLFSEPGVFDAVVRWSSGSPGFPPDREPGVRGIAVKLFDVEGEKVIEGLEGASTQDFLFIQSPATPVRDSTGFVSLVWSLRDPRLALLRLIGAFGLSTFRVLSRAQASFGVSTARLAHRRWYTALPIKFGTHAAKLVLRPVGAPAELEERPGIDSLGEEFAQELASRDIVFELCAQFFEDESVTPIEDASVEWRERDAPCVLLARLVFPTADLTSEPARARSEEIEEMSFDPWHCTEDFRPLGEMMRARRVAYRYSSMERGASLEPGARL